MKKYFDVVRLHRDDITNIVYPDDTPEHEAKRKELADKLTDDIMQRIAVRLGDDMMDGGGFWESLRDYTDDILLELK